MAESPSVKGFFKALVTDQLISRVVEATVGVVVGGPVGPVAATLVSKAIEYYGPAVANRFWAWIKGQPPLQACTALEAVANLDPRSASAIIDEVIEEAAPGAPSEAKRLAKNYLVSIPATLRQTLPRATSGKSTFPAALLPRDEREVYKLLPTFLPPYNAPCSLPGTDYQLQELVGTGGFGAVYKANLRFEHEPRAIKFCLDPERTHILIKEKEKLDRLMQQAREGGRGWPQNVVRLTGHNLDHETPFLIFEYVPDGDLSVHLQSLKAKQQGRDLTHDEVLNLMLQLARAVAHVHAAGLTHRDLKPSNILFDGPTIKIADFGLGAVVPHSGLSTARQRQTTETTQELRGAGSLLYMSREQKRGAVAHQAQDVYSLGVIWYQLLVGDFSAELGASWKRPLGQRGVPDDHIKLLESCLDDEAAERPQNAGELADRLSGILTGSTLREQTAREEQSRRQKQDSAEQADWEAARRDGTAHGVESFLKRYPNGRYHQEARQKIGEILRNELKGDLLNRSLRRRYLAARTPRTAQA